MVKLQPNKGISRIDPGQDRDSYILKLIRAQQGANAMPNHDDSMDFGNDTM